MIVRKEPLTSWPEVDPEASKNARRFESLAAGLDENQDTFDPETLIRHNDSPGAEEIFPVYGESDEENEYDEKTWREIEEEQGTLGRPRMALKKQVISEEEAIQAIDEAVAEMVDDWRLRKFPKRQHKAFGVWRKYSKQPALQVNRLKAIATRLDHFKEDRIPKLHEEILKQPFTSQKQVKKQALSMETTIHDRQSLLWEQAIITQRQAPVRLPPRPRASKALKKTVAFLGDDEDGESIGSYENTSSSDSIDNFIVSGSEDELLELNLADGEKVEVGVEVEEDRDDGDSIEALDIDVDVTDASFPKTSTPAASTAIETTVRNPGFDLQPEREPGLAPVTPRKPRPVASVSMSPIVISSDEEAVRFHDLTIPQRKPTTNIMLKMPKPADKRESISLISDSDETTKLTDVGNLPRLDDPVSIGRYPVKEWIRIEDRERLVIAVLQRIAVGPRTSVVALASTLSTKQMWTDMTNTLEVLTAVDKNTLNGQSQESYEGTKYLLRLFWIYVTCKNQNVKLIKKGKATIEEGYDKYFSSFHALCKDFERGFGKAINADANYDDDDNDVEDEGPRSATQRKPQSTSPEYDAQSHSQMSVKKKLYKAKKLVEDATACDMRKCNQERLVEQEARRAEVRKDFPQFDGTQHDNIIINETKASHEGLITVNDGIGRLIKPHQVDGVRFMWNEVVAGQQGCLLAHTMGLGKTMQAITLLVAIAEASQSPDETISSQIPESLRTTKTLILCPPSLINNWMDELYFWVPKDLLVLQKVDVQYPAIQRLSIIKHWFENGGVLVMGYNMFSTLIHNKDTDERLAPLSKELHAEAKTHLLEGPSTIVADEAHKMKNVTAQISQAASQFKSLHRIALTGSPLSNNVLEYYSMIDWAVPGYFGPLKEFRQKYVVPIEEGLYEDSTSYQRRKSVKWLEILKSDVGPKINRANMSVLSKDLPPKKEFVVNVPLTNLQVKAYSLYVKEMQTSKPHQLTKDGGITNSTLWTWLAILRLICNHPACCKAQLLQRKNKTKTPVLPKKNEKGESSAATETTENDEDLGAGVSQSLIQQLSALFQSETNDIQEPTLSNKVTVLCQILDASKAAGDKVLLFTQSLHTITYLEKLFALQGRFYMKLDGKTLTSKRQAMVKEFNEGDAEIYLISTTAGGLGLNLQGANRVVIFDFKWNPTEETQAIGRAYRFGQKKPVFVYRFVAGGTFEGIVFNKMVFKTQLASRVIDCRRPNPKASILPSDYLFEPKSVEQKELDWVRGKDPQVLDYILNNHAEASTIREILETDSFEEELNDDLHPDDRKEVEIESKRAYLKRTNPAEYARQVKHKALAEQKAQQVAHQNAIAQQHGQKLTYQSPHYGAQQNGQKTPRQYSQHLPIVPGSTINSKTPNAEAQAVPATSASGPSHKVLSREVSMPFFDALTEALGDQAKALELRNPIIRHFSKRYGLDNDAAICDAVNLATNQLKLARGRYKSGSLDDKVFARAIIDSIESKKQAAIASLKTTLQRAVTSPAGPKTSGIPTNTLTAEASSSKTGPVVSTALTINNAELPVILKATAPATDNANTLEFAPKGFTRMTISNDKPAVNPAADTYEPNISNGSVNANVHVNGNGKIPKTSPERTARPSVLISPVPSEDTSDTESIQNLTLFRQSLHLRRQDPYESLSRSTNRKGLLSLLVLQVERALFEYRANLVTVLPPRSCQNGLRKRSRMPATVPIDKTRGQNHRFLSNCTLISPIFFKSQGWRIWDNQHSVWRDPRGIDTPLSIALLTSVFYRG
ncbi:hypothetical protein BJ878DRAFT_217508 [Calycina marina]|uniref:Uncharacterized protein n=1 Tax=Calycina marina TaxID=1763456 RepID=A0A9P8CCI4_9HELO|nr:hypothetical protein BJ878DRAFT_217508 [Calycina marina]